MKTRTRGVHGVVAAVEKSKRKTTFSTRRKLAARLLDLDRRLFSDSHNPAESSGAMTAFPETQRIGMDAYPCMMNGNPTTIPRSPLNRLAFDSKTARRVDRELSDAEDYAARWPDTQRIGLL
jgi:hypothetical protein